LDAAYLGQMRLKVSLRNKLVEVVVDQLKQQK
jgi:hypothetical protein